MTVKYCCHGSVHRAKTRFKRGSGVQHKRLGGWLPKTLYLPFQTLRYIGMAARGALVDVEIDLRNAEQESVIEANLL